MLRRLAVVLAVIISALTTTPLLAFSPEADDDVQPPDISPDVAQDPEPEPEPEKPIFTSKYSATQLALRDTISFAEGTFSWTTGKPDYTIRFGEHPKRGGSLDLTKPHPIYARANGYYVSNASGAFQFMSPTWIAMWGYNAPMTPDNQDTAFFKLVRTTGYSFNYSFRAQYYLLSSQWASIPTRSGYSYYGQPSKSVHSLDNFYQKRYVHYDTALNDQPKENQLS